MGLRRVFTSAALYSLLFMFCRFLGASYFPFVQRISASEHLIAGRSLQAIGSGSATWPGDAVRNRLTTLSRA
jgi:hypothetical protein